MLPWGAETRACAAGAVAGAAGAVAAMVLLGCRRPAAEDASSAPHPPPPPPVAVHEPMDARGASVESTVIDAPDLDMRLLRKAECAVRGRTSRLTIVVERCTNDHNYSAILRTAEALGVQNVWIIAPPEQATVAGVAVAGDGDDEDADEETTTSTSSPAAGGTALLRSTGVKVTKAAPSEIQARALHHIFARKATEWLDVREFDDTASCVAALRASGHTIWATDLGQEAVRMTHDDLAASTPPEALRAAQRGSVVPAKLAIVFGTESVGVSAALLAAADKRVYLPLRGFADSLNLSVATALCVHQLFTLDPGLVGAMAEEERRGLRRVWFTRLARQRIETRAEKKTRRWLAAAVDDAEEIQRKAAAGHPPHPNQQKKLDELPSKRAALAAHDAAAEARAAAAIERYIAEPPSPLSDMRRTDEHRVTFAGRNTKAKSKELWVDMPATANYSGRPTQGAQGAAGANDTEL